MEGGHTDTDGEHPEYTASGNWGELVAEIRTEGMVGQQLTKTSPVMNQQRNQLEFVRRRNEALVPIEEQWLPSGGRFQCPMGASECCRRLLAALHTYTVLKCWAGDVPGPYPPVDH